MKLYLRPLCVLYYVDDLGYNDEGRKIYGSAAGPVMRILKTEKGNVGLLEHEFEHVRQFWKLGLVHCLRYIFSKDYREWAERKAREAQRNANAISKATS